MMWHGALLARWNPKKQLPDLKNFLSGHKEKNKVESLSGNDIMAQLKGYQDKRDKRKGHQK